MSKGGKHEARLAEGRAALARGEGVVNKFGPGIEREHATATKGFSKVSAQADLAADLLSGGIDAALGSPGEDEEVDRMVAQAMEAEVLRAGGSRPTAPTGDQRTTQHTSRGHSPSTPGAGAATRPTTQSRPSVDPTLSPEQLLAHDNIRPLLTEFRSAVLAGQHDKCPTLVENGITLSSKKDLETAYRDLEAELKGLGASEEVLRETQSRILDQAEIAKAGLLDLESTVANIGSRPISREQQEAIALSAGKTGYTPEGMLSLAAQIQEQHLDRELLELEGGDLDDLDLEDLPPPPLTAEEQREFDSFYESLSPAEQAAFDAELDAELEAMVAEIDREREPATTTLSDAELEAMLEDEGLDDLAELLGPIENVRPDEHGFQASSTPGLEGPAGRTGPGGDSSGRSV